MIVSLDEHAQNLWVNPNCGHHDRINAQEYFSILFDEGKCTELDKNMKSGDPLKFKDTKAYSERYNASVKKTGLKDAVSTTRNALRQAVTISAMNFNLSAAPWVRWWARRSLVAFSIPSRTRCPSS